MAKLVELNDEQNDVLDFICHNASARTRFFSKVSEGIWFKHLQKKGLLEPSERLGAQNNQAGGHYLPNWEILQYLEKLIKRINSKEEKNVDYRDVLDVMNNTAKYVNDGHYSLSVNYYIGSRFVNLFSIMPVDKYSLEDLKVLDCWMNDEKNNEIVSSEVYLHLLPKLLADTSEDTKSKIVYLMGAVLARYTNDSLNKDNDVYWMNEFFSKSSKLVMENDNFLIVFKIIFNKLEQILKQKDSEVMIEIKKGNSLLVKLTEIGSDYELLLPNKEKYIISNKEMESFFSFYNVAQNGLIAICAEENLCKSYAWLLYAGLYNKDSYESVHDMKNEYSLDVVSTLVCAIKQFFELDDNKVSIEETKKAIKECLYSRFFLLTKLGLFGISRMTEPNVYSKMFTDALQDERTYLKIFESYLSEDELAKVLNKIPKEASWNIIMDKIKSGPEIIEDYNENKKLATTLWRQERCRELRHIPQFEDMYNELRMQTNKDRNLMPAISFTGSELKEMCNESPYNVQRLLAMTSQEIEIALKKFKQESAFSEITFHGLGNVVEKVAEVAPEKFLKNKRNFLSVGYIYIYHILHACNTLINRKEFVLWNEMFDYMKELMKEKDFWDNKFVLEDRSGWQANNEWVVSSISEILQTISEEESEFIYGYSDKIIEIIKLISKNVNKNLDEPYEKASKDLPTYLINNSWCKVVHAWLAIVVKLKKNETIEVKRKYSKCYAQVDEMKNAFLKSIQEQDDISVATAGLYFLMIYYCDSVYALKIRDEVLKLQSLSKKLFLLAYLRHNKLYDAISSSLFAVYEFAVGETFDARIRNKIVEHVALEYLTNPDQRFEQLFEKIYIENNADDMASILKCFAHNCDKKNSIKIYKIWHNVMENKKYATEAEKQKVYGATGQLAQMLETFDSPESELILKAAPEIIAANNLFYVVERLDKIKGKGDKSKTLGNIFRLFTICFKNGYPIYDTQLRDSIMKFVKENEKIITDELLSLKVKMDDTFGKAFPKNDLYPQK